MKFLIAAVVLVGATTFSNVNAADYTFQNLFRTEIVSPSNDLLSVVSRDDDPYSTITFSKQITQSNSLLIKGKMTNQQTGDTVTSGGPWNLCDDSSLTGWEKFAMFVFKLSLVPRASRRKWCPVKPQQYRAQKIFEKFGARVDGDTIPLGDYKLEYSAISSTGQDVFTSIVYTLSLNTRPYQAN